MNTPEYIVVEQLGLVVAEIKGTLELPVLNYQYGYIKELDETLRQWGTNSVDAVQRFPLVYVEQPFRLIRGESAAYYARIELLRIFIMQSTQITYKASERMQFNYKPIIYPIKRELLNQLDLSVAFNTNGISTIKHIEEDRFYWGESQQSVLTNPVDCTIVTIKDLVLANNPNCTPSYNFSV